MRPCSARIRSDTSRRRPGNVPYVDAGDLLGRGDQRRKTSMSQTDADALEHREVALEPGAGVDARRRQRHQLAVGLGVELHEHEVPDLDVAVLVAAGPAVGAELGAEVPEDLRAGAARAGVGHAPEVVVAQALDALGRHARRRRARSPRPRRRWRGP